MDGRKFDDLVRTISRSRRALFGLGAALGLGPLLADAKKRKKRKKKKTCKSCTACQICKKGRCKPKPEGTDCGQGQVCQAGVCACPNRGEPCGGVCCDAGEGCLDAATQKCIVVGGICSPAMNICETANAEVSRCDDRTQERRCYCRAISGGAMLCMDAAQPCVTCETDAECVSGLGAANARCVAECAVGGCGFANGKHCVAPCANPQI